MNEKTSHSHTTYIWVALGGKLRGIPPVSLLELTSLNKQLNRLLHTEISNSENCSIKINLQLLQSIKTIELPSKIPSEVQSMKFTAEAETVIRVIFQSKKET